MTSQNTILALAIGYRRCRGAKNCPNPKSVNHYAGTWVYPDGVHFTGLPNFYEDQQLAMDALLEEVKAGGWSKGVMMHVQIIAGYQAAKVELYKPGKELTRSARGIHGLADACCEVVLASIGERIALPTESEGRE